MGHKIFIKLFCLSIMALSCVRKEEAIGLQKPEQNRFTKIILAEELDEPMQFEILNDGRVLFVERKGKIKVFEPKVGRTRIIGDIPVSIGYYSKTGEELAPTGEDGMQGVAVDPDFQENGWIYLYYSPKGGDHRSILTRYTWKGDSLNTNSMKKLLEVPNQRESCCHLGGGMVFDQDGNLLLSTGDNTPNDPRGYSPLDERPGRSRFDSQRSSGNTNDLRGKILRIHPEPDGTYTIPEGNLFPNNTSETRPEIYTMGNRNPWRLSLDSKTGWLYWGEVGPSGTADSIGMGPKSYDEFNQARKAGNFGWPYFLADNKAYWEYDYESGKSLEKFDPAQPINNSPNNSGMTRLPPAEPAFIWYPQSEAMDFPLLGSGSNSAVGGPIYHRSDFHNPKRPFPAYYEGKWFITDWTRGWIMAVTFNEDGDFGSMEEFFPGIDLSGPIDIGFGPDGDLFILEYGRGPYHRNRVAQLVKIEYTEGNRKPEVQIAASERAGAVPFKVRLSSAGTKDYDDNPMEFKWEIATEGKSIHSYTEADPEIILDVPGIYKVNLTVTDSEGAKSEKTLDLYAGNQPPVVSFDLDDGNKSFFFPDYTIDYSVMVKDEEDGALGKGIDPDSVEVQIDYLPDDFYLKELTPTLQNTSATEPLESSLANLMIDKSDCRSCHTKNTKSIGPAYMDIAKRYEENPNAQNYLTNKVITGGSGNWEVEMAMPAHPTIPKEDVNSIVKYILSLNDENSKKPLAVNGSFVADSLKDNLHDSYIFRASYTDKGGASTPEQLSTKMLVLRNPEIPVVNFDDFINVEINHSIIPDFSNVSPKDNGAALVLEKTDLTGVREILFTLSEKSAKRNALDWKIEVRIDSIEGKLIGETEDNDKGEISAKISPTTDYHDLYLVFVKKESGKDSGDIHIRRVRFGR